MIKKKKKLAFKLSKSDKTFGIKNAVWKKGFIVAAVLLVSLFILEQVRVYYKDQQLKKDYQQLINIPSDWKFVDSEFVGDPYCGFGLCQGIYSRYQITGSFEEEFDKLVKKNNEEFNDFNEACLSNFDDPQCTSLTLQNQEYIVWVNFYSDIKDRKMTAYGTLNFHPKK